MTLVRLRFLELAENLGKWVVFHFWRNSRLISLPPALARSWRDSFGEAKPLTTPAPDAIYFVERKPNARLPHQLWPLA